MIAKSVIVLGPHRPLPNRSNRSRSSIKQRSSEAYRILSEDLVAETIVRCSLAPSRFSNYLNFRQLPIERTNALPNCLIVPVQIRSSHKSNKLNNLLNLSVSIATREVDVSLVQYQVAMSPTTATSSEGDVGKWCRAFCTTEVS